MTLPDLHRGDLIMVEWEDATEDSVGNPHTAKPARRTSYSLFWDIKLNDGRESLVTTNTIDTDIPDQQGWAAYPIGMILKVTIIKRHKRQRAKKNEPTPPPAAST